MSRVLNDLNLYMFVGLEKNHYNNLVNNIYSSFKGKLAKGIQELLIIYNLAPNTILQCWKGYDSDLKCNKTFVIMLKKKST